VRAAWRDVDWHNVGCFFLPNQQDLWRRPDTKVNVWEWLDVGRQNKKEEKLDADAVGELRRRQRYGVNFR
jgi:hypothetical protein